MEGFKAQIFEYLNSKPLFKLRWKPEYDLAGLVEDMMSSNIRLTQKDMHLVEGGHEVLDRQSSLLFD